MFLISRQGSYKLIESDEQWKLIQEQRNVSQHRSGGHHRSASAHSKKGDVGQNNLKYPVEYMDLTTSLEGVGVACSYFLVWYEVY